MTEPFPAAWMDILRHNVYHYQQLSAKQQAKLRDHLRIIVDEKNWEGCAGMTITDEVRVTIAAQASLLVLGFEDEYFDAVQSILVYPTAYVAHGHTVTQGGVVLEGQSNRAGEAWHRGPVILSWDGALAGGRHQSGGSNLVLHEFAHQLDMQNGRVADGIPPLNTREEYQRWETVAAGEYAQLVEDCRHGRRTLLDCYGTTNMAEFFAVATECFFERPREMHRRHPQFYEVLRDYYRQDLRG